MRIAFVMPGRANSGGVRVAGIVAKGLLCRGHAVRILCRCRSFVERLRLIRSEKLLGAQDWLEGFAGDIEGFKDIRECRFDESEIIVGVGMAMSYQLGFLASVPNPKVQYLHGSNEWEPELTRSAISIPLPKIVVASYLRKVVADKGAGEVLAIVPNGIDPTEYYPSVPESERNGVGTMYSSHPAKDPATVLKVVHGLMKLRPEVPVRVFGGDRRPSQLPSSLYTRFPSVQRAREIYSRSRVWIVGSSSEGFCLPALEAMACGCVVVTTDCGGPRDMIVNRENGFFVPIGDVNALMDRICVLLDDDELRNRLRTRGMETAKQFTWPRTIDKLEAALEEVRRFVVRQ